MTFFKKLAIVAAFAATAVTGAHAAPVTEYMKFDLVNSTENDPGVYTGTYKIDSITGATAIDADTYFDPVPTPVPALVKGDSFIDDFFLTIQDDQYVSFYTNVKFGPKPTALFDSVGLFDFVGGEYVPVDFINSPTSLFEDGFFLHSGSYVLEISGSILANGGGFTGVLTTSPIPEPSSLALMLAGIGAMFSLARRRNNRQA